MQSTVSRGLASNERLAALIDNQLETAVIHQRNERCGAVLAGVCSFGLCDWHQHQEVDTISANAEVGELCWLVPCGNEEEARELRRLGGHRHPVRHCVAPMQAGGI